MFIRNVCKYLYNTSIYVATYIPTYTCVYMTSYVCLYLCRNEVIKSTWIQNPTKRPTFAMIVQNLSSMCNFTDELNPQVAEDSTTHAEDAAESNGYISVLPK